MTLFLLSVFVVMSSLIDHIVISDESTLFLRFILIRFGLFQFNPIPSFRLCPFDFVILTLSS